MAPAARNGEGLYVIAQISPVRWEGACRAHSKQHARWLSVFLTFARRAKPPAANSDTSAVISAAAAGNASKETVAGLTLSGLAAGAADGH